MKLSELKELILTQELSDDFMIFKYAEDTFLIDQYIAEICNFKGLSRNNIEQLTDINNKAISLIYDYSADLNVLVLDKDTPFAEQADYSSLKNTIVVCNKIDKKLEKSLADSLVAFPKITDWQAVDYLKTLGIEIKDEDLSWLFSAAKNNLYRTELELDKLSLFNNVDQELVFTSIREEPNSDLYIVNVFELIKAIINKDISYVVDFIKHKSYTDVTPFGLVALLLNKLKKILYLRCKTGKSLESLGISFGEAKYLDQDFPNICGELVYVLLQDKIKFLADIDLRLKVGTFEATDEELIDYIICGVMC